MFRLGRSQSNLDLSNTIPRDHAMSKSRKSNSSQNLTNYAINGFYNVRKQEIESKIKEIFRGTSLLSNT